MALKSDIHSFIHSLILLSVLRQGYSLFQSEFSTEGDLLLPLSISKLLSFSLGNPGPAYAFFLVWGGVVVKALRY
jgi:hypothetical protein